MLGRGLIALAVAVTAAFLLFKDVADRTPSPAVARAKPPLLTLDVPPGGTLYFVAERLDGDDSPSDPRVYRLADGALRPAPVLPPETRAWSVSAWGDNVVLSAEGRSMFAAGAAVGLDGSEIAADAHTPAAGPGGRLAYQGFVRGRQVTAAFVRWSGRGRFRAIARHGIWSMDFLPDGRLVIVQRRRAQPWILVYGPGGLEHRFRTRGNAQYELLVTSDGLIGYEGGTGRLRVYTPAGRLRASLDVEGWLAAGTRGRQFLLTERDGERIASLSPRRELRVIGRHDPGYFVHSLEWEPR